MTIPESAKTAILDKDPYGTCLNIENLSPSACNNFSKYKGKRSPFCGCRPCMEKYLSTKNVIFSDKSMAELFL